jgi:2-hydroxy-6-oxo-6-(2'-carboxyphenyl)-hexa-2,4-dienoate hydrolase
MGEERWIEVDGIRTRYFDTGDGEPLVLIHGGNFGQFENVDCAENWALNWEGFARSFRVVAFDKLGQGFTDNPKQDDYTIEAVVRHATRFIRTLDLDRCHVVGHSRGGYVATRLTLEHQPHILTLTLVDSSTTVPGLNLLRGPLLADAPRPLLSRESLAWVTDAFSYSSNVATSEWLDVRTRIAQLPKNAEAVGKMYEQEEVLFLPSLYRQKEETLTRIQKGDLTTPTLLIWGKNDPSAVLDGGLKLFEIISARCPHSHMHIINQAGHYCYREHPDDFVEIVSAFVRGCTSFTEGERLGQAT